MEDFQVVEDFQEDGKMFEEFIEEMKKLEKDNIISVVHFGSEGQPNNLLFVFKKLDFVILNRIRPLIIRQRKIGNVVPLIFTEDELFSGSDVFPLEFLDIKYPHKTIYGKEIVDKIRFDKKHVRRQIEYELRSKLLHLRENYIWAKKDKELDGLAVSAIPSLMPLFYGLLFLKDVKPSAELDDLYKSVSEKYKLDLNILKDIKSKNNISSQDVKGLMGLLEKMIVIIDKIKV